MGLPYVIFELANAHGGSRERLLKTIQSIRSFKYARKAVKLQAFKPDTIALPTFSWYPTYQELFQLPEAWAEVIRAAAGCGDVWLDIFDLYGIEILKANRQSVAGIKLQASVLDNLEVIEALEQAGLRSVQLMINVTGYELSQISEYVERFRTLGAAQLILQVGMQAYPTAARDTGLQKIPILRAAFPAFPLCFADHAPGPSQFARIVPMLALAAGCHYLEKHFCPSRSEAKYDFHSALEPAEMQEMLAGLSDAALALEGPFVSSAEAAYLKKTYQAPIARRPLLANTLIGRSDLVFRRTDKPGLTWGEIQGQQGQFSILSRAVPEHAPISPADFKPARIGAIVACRMKSSRLKHKATLPIHGKASVERCLENCLRFQEVNEVILATSTLEEDAVLETYRAGGRAKFWRGDPEDVIQRYLGACDRFGIAVVVRVTADCPVVSPEITSFLLQRHFADGADYTAARDCAVGSAGEVYNTEALRRIVALLGRADRSEYMTWYLRNNADLFKVNLVDLPPELKRDYRLTLDYSEDLEMFERLYAGLEKRGLDPTLSNVFSILDGDPSIPAINGHLTLRYRTDQKLIDELNRVTRIPKSLHPNA